jgi:2-iminobutanoate/2-iminopropanoate deaminase
MMEPIRTPNAPAAIGPYSQAIADGELLFCSGQIAIDPATGKLVGGDAAAQARRALGNLKAVLEAGGAGLDGVLKTTVYLKDLRDFPAVNAVYAEVFGAHRPARATVQVAALPMEALVEIDAIARRR